MSGLEIICADGRGARRQFLELPYRLYRDDPNWVPPLRSRQRRLFAGRGAFLEHADMALLLARRGGRPVARVAAIHNRAHNDRHGDRVGFFGFFECARDDAGAAAAVLGAAETWLAARGLDTLRGPVNPSMNAECGLLVDGFDSPPMALMPYNPPQYAALLESAGLAKCKDLYAYLLLGERLDETTAPRERLARLAAAARKRHPELSIRCLDMADYQADVLRFLDVFERARRDNWGHVPLTRAEALQTAAELRRVVDPGLIFLAEVAGRPAGASLALPNISPALAAAGGRLLPFGWLRFARQLKRTREMRIFGIAALEPYRHMGITGLLFLETILAGLARGIRRAEASWVLEDNLMSNRSITGGLAPELYKTYRIYEKAIGGQAT